MTIRTFIVGSALAAGVLGLSAPASAATWTTSGTNEKGNPVSASADITLSGGVITIDLSNLGDDMIASNQGISGLFLSFDGDVTGTSAFTQSGSLYTLNGSTNTATAVAGNPNHWGASVITGGDVRVWTLTGGQPSNLIAQAAGQDFSGLNNGVSTHNPYILGTGHFTLAYTGDLTKVTGVKFLFATEQDGKLFDGECQVGCGGGTPPDPSGAVPEPSAWALMITGFGTAGALLRRRRTPADLRA